MAQRVLTLPTSDFRGGLNYRADAFQLGENETPDCLNVDLDPRGGFAMRRVVGPMHTVALGSIPFNIWSFVRSDAAAGYRQILVQQSSDFAYSTGGNFTVVNPDALVTSGRMRAATFKDGCYIQRNAEQVPVRWNGAAAVVMADPAAAGYADSYASPSTGRVALGKYTAVFRNYLWVANVNENGTRYRSRLRWSHPGTAEAWRTNDWIDVEPDDGDQITGIAAYGDQLVVFKNNSVHVIRGYDADTFEVVNVSRHIGALQQEAIAVSDMGVFFFSWPEGLCLYDGKGIKNLWQARLGPTTERDTGTIDQTQLSEITVGWVKQRCWVSVPEDGAVGGNTATYVWDPLLGKDGGWTKYSLGLGPYLDWRAYQEPNLHLACPSVGYKVLKLENDGSVDNFDGVTDVDVESYYTTRWYDLGNPALKKRWKRPQFVLDSEYAYNVRVDVFADYDTRNVKRSFTLGTTSDDTGGVWGTAVWDTDVWGGNPDADAQALLRGSLLGNATAVQLKVTLTTSPSVPWGVNSITYRYIPKRIR